MTIVEFLLLALGVYRLTRLLIEDEILDTPRNKLLNRLKPGSKLMYLATCYWCVSVYVAVLVVALYLLVPGPTLVVCAILAFSAVAGLIDDRK